LGSLRSTRWTPIADEEGEEDGRDEEDNEDVSEDEVDDSCSWP
jgi:hypothetical protein